MEENQYVGKRERSPTFPYVSIDKAIDYVGLLFAAAKRHEVLLSDAAESWGFRPTSSSTLRVAAALVAYGLIEDNGSGKSRRIKISEAGWRILEDSRPGVREALVAEAAIKPAALGEYIEKWSEGRPSDSYALSQLKFEGGFTDEGAAKFLRVYDETVEVLNRLKPKGVADTGVATPGQPIEEEIDESAEHDAKREQSDRVEVVDDSSFKSVPLKPESGERELLSGILSKSAKFRLIVSGPVGAAELDKLIAKLNIDKEILADDSVEE